MCITVYEENKDAIKFSVCHHTAALGNSSCIIQDNCGSCNPVLVMSRKSGISV